MSNLPAFDRDAYLRELNTEVLETWEAESRCFAVLQDTLFYPEGGGQPADRGDMNGIPVLDAQKRDGRIVHTLERAVLPGRAHLSLDWPRRFDHMQQHTGQHLLTAVAQDRCGWETIAFHLGPVTCDIELATPRISPTSASPKSRRSAPSRAPTRRRSSAPTSSSVSTRT